MITEIRDVWVRLWGLGPGGAVADPVMAVPIDQNLGLVLAVQSSLPQTQGKFSFKSSTFGHYLYENGQKSFQLQGASPHDPRPGALPLDLARGSAPRLPFRLALRALAMSPSPLANPGSPAVESVVSSPSGAEPRPPPSIFLVSTNKIRANFIYI